MRGRTTFAFALSVAACQQTVVLDQRQDAGGNTNTDAGLPFCSGPPLDFIVESPEVIVALDRSAAMGARFGDGTIMLTAVRDAIDMYATKYQKVVHFGYIDFPGSSLCSQSQQPGCCAGTVSPPASNFPAFDLALHACEQSQTCTVAGYQRPTTSALASCALVFSQPSGAFRRYVLLITNGRPDCGSNQSSGCIDAQYVTNQLANSGVATVVVAPGPLDVEDADCLQAIAAYGGAHNPPFFRPAGTPNELANELSAVTRAMAMDACELNLQARIVDPDRVAFRWKDMTIPRDRDRGWELTRNGFEIILHGDWCDRLIGDGPDDGPGYFALYTDCSLER